MQDDGLQPEIVIAPQNLDLDNARALYGELRKDTAIPNNPLKYQDDGDGLYINSDVAAAWNELVMSPTRRPDGTQPPRVEDSLRHAWTIRLIPGTDRPTDTNVDHTANSEVHPTIAEYLTLQATRIQTGETPIDGNTWTWLNGTFEGSGQAPGGYWYSGFGQVGVHWDDVGGSNGFLGVRLPVW